MRPNVSAKTEGAAIGAYHSLMMHTYTNINTGRRLHWLSQIIAKANRAYNWNEGLVARR